MEIDIGIAREERASMGGVLSKLLANAYVLYLKTQNVHWNIHGPEFFSLHKLSEGQYGEMATFIDEIAERIRTLGFFVEGTMERFQHLSLIKENHEVCSKHKYIEDLIQGHEILIRCARDIANLADKQEDHATVDLIGRLLGFHEKACWMLRSHIQ